MNALDGALQKKMDLWIYTGYTMNQLEAQTEIIEYDENFYIPEEFYQNACILRLMKRASHIVDGKFELDKADKTLAFRGSSNQHIWHHVAYHVGLPYYEDVTEKYDKQVKK